MEETAYFTKQDINRVNLWKNRKPLLNRLDIELTERCNNNCIHCNINLPVDDKDALEKELTTNEIKRILKEAVSLGCLAVRFTGGEPLLRGDFEELYIYARKLGLKVLLFTNATLITPYLAGLFCRIPPRIEIEVTLYGMRKQSYEAVTRAPGSFEAFWQGINLLLENKVPFIVKGAYLSPDKSEIDEFERWAKTIPGMGRFPAYVLFFDLHARRDPIKNNLIKKLRVTPQEGVEFLLKRHKDYLKETQEFCAKFMRPCGDKLFSCGAGKGTGCIDAYGKFQACLLLRHPDTVYDLKSGSLKDALTNFFPKIRAMKATHPDYLRRCAQCSLKGLCEQCPGKSWMEHSRLDTPVEYLCEIAHTQARYLGINTLDRRKG